MKALILTVVLAVISVFSGCLSQAAAPNSVADTPGEQAPKGEKRPVLVELFTSEGCSSCPPADRLLTTLTNEQSVANAEIITLEFHVDYWDHDGWKDRFSSASYTERQTAYSRQFGIGDIYTPQMVVDGSSQFVGSNGRNASDAIARGAEQPKAAIDLAIAANKLKASISGLALHHDATVYLAVAESKLVTKVDGGENAGSTLEHTSVVRDLAPIGTIAGAETAQKLEWAIPTNADWKKENLRYVVFVQDNSTLKVLAVRQIAP